MGKGLGLSLTPIMAGTRQDIERLLKQFEQRESLRYKDFANIFRQNGFSTIFIGRQTQAELVEFCEKLLILAVELTLTPPSCTTSPMHEKVGGIYLLYGLFYLQPTPCRMPIRMTPDQMRHLLFFMEHRLKPDGHLDVLYVLFKMFADNAFGLVRFAHHYNPLLYRNYDYPWNDVEIRQGKPTQFDVQFDELNSLANDIVTHQTDVVHNKYLVSKLNSFDCDTLNLLTGESPKTFIERMHSDYLIMVSNRMNTNTTKSKKDESRQHFFKSTRADLKQKAYNTVTEQSRRRLGTKHDSDVASGSELPSSKDQGSTQQLDQVGRRKPRSRKVVSKPAQEMSTKKLKTKVTAPKKKPTKAAEAGAMMKPVSTVTSPSTGTKQKAASKSEPERAKRKGRPRLQPATLPGEELMKSADQALTKLRRRGN